MLEFLTLGTTILNKLFPDKNEREKYQLQLLQLQQQGEFKAEELRFNAITTEAKSEDKWTSRARPFFLYVVYVIILFSIPIGFFNIFYPSAILTFINGFKLWLQAIPNSMWELFGAGYLGYGAMRSFDKTKK